MWERSNVVKIKQKEYVETNSDKKADDGEK